MMVVLVSNHKYLSALPLILSFSQQARLGALATWRNRIRKRMPLEKGRQNRALRVRQRSLSRRERDRVRDVAFNPDAVRYDTP